MSFVGRFLAFGRATTRLGDCRLAGTELLLLPFRVPWRKSQATMTKSSIEAGAADRLDFPARAVLYGAGALAAIAGPVLFFLPRDTASQRCNAAFDGPALSLGLYIPYLVSFGTVALASLMRLWKGAGPTEEDATRSRSVERLTD